MDNNFPQPASDPNIPELLLTEPTRYFRNIIIQASKEKLKEGAFIHTQYLVDSITKTLQTFDLSNEEYENLIEVARLACANHIDRMNVACYKSLAYDAPIVAAVLLQAIQGMAVNDIFTQAFLSVDELKKLTAQSTKLIKKEFKINTLSERLGDGYIKALKFFKEFHTDISSDARMRVNEIETILVDYGVIDEDFNNFDTFKFNFRDSVFYAYQALDTLGRILAQEAYLEESIIKYKMALVIYCFKQ